MRDWARNGRFTNVSDFTFHASTTQIDIANWWKFGPGEGGVADGSFIEATQGQWEGNPDRLLNIAWSHPASVGQIQYAPNFRFTFLENYGTHSARALAGKQITLSWQLLSPGGCTVAPVIWRGGLDIPVQYRTPFPDISMQLWSGDNFSVGSTVRRCDFTMTLPAVPPQTSTNMGTYLGFGLDLIGQTGPTLVVGPMQMNEGGPQPFEEIPAFEAGPLASMMWP